MIKFKKIIFSLVVLLFFTQNCYGVIQDSLYATVGKKAITYSDIVNEIKIILILNNESFSEEKRNRLEATAIKTAVQKNIKQIEIEKFSNLNFSNAAVDAELLRIAIQTNRSLDDLKKAFDSNGIDIMLVRNRIETDLLWNSLIFQIYKNNLNVDENEINEQLAISKNKKNISEFLLSEIIFNLVEKDNFELEAKKIKEKIKSEGFEQVAMSLSIAETAKNGGNLGWISETVMDEKFKSNVMNTRVGETSKPMLLPNGILIFKVNDKRIKKNEIDLEKIKNELVSIEKNKLLNMYSLSHYDKIRRSIAIDYFKTK